MGWHSLSTTLGLVTSLLALTVCGQKDNLGLKNGYISLSTGNWDLKLVKDAQVLASLTPKGNSFDFLPFDYLPVRTENEQYHNGDITFRYRATGETKWVEVDSAKSRKAVTVVQAKDALAAADLTPTLPANSSLRIIRKWVDVDGDLGLSFTITNAANQDIEIGSLGFPIEFNSIFTNRTPEEMSAKCSLTDPYIGMDAGYLQITPTSGTGEALIVTPLGNTSTSFEAWRDIDEPYFDSTAYGSQTFEGFYEWLVHSKAYADTEWRNAKPWNPPTSRILKAGQSTTVGLRFSRVKDGIRGIQKAVRATNTPLTIGTGYVVPRDQTVQLRILAPTDVVSVVSEGNALTITRKENTLSLTPTGSAWGRNRLTITYADGKTQTVHYFITESAPDAVARLGQFSTSTMWFTDRSDPFGRAPSIMSYDASTRKPLLQDPRVWIAGLSDEGGVIYMATAMKQSAHPDAKEIAKLEEFVSKVLFPTIQNGGDLVRKSIFFYEPSAVPGYSYSKSIDWGNWWSWNKADSYSTQRSYDYIHVVATYWALYRAGRDQPGLLKQNTWQWYLGRAVNTTIACFATDSAGRELVQYSRVGQMGETVIGELLHDLRREGWSKEADAVEVSMKKRADLWNSQAEPFGSEMAWDSTGQEGVYYWSNYFKLTNTATKTINSILGYMPTVSHWGWNGNARRYWDFIYAGKLQRIERMIHHYGSSLNAIPLLAQFRQQPKDTYLLRVGYGGVSGPLTNIRQDGSMYNAFHSFPDTLAGDDYSGDYGPNFLGVMLASATYVVEDPDLGLVAYGGNLAANGQAVTVQPRDAVRQRVYIASMGVYIVTSSGWIDQFSFARTNAKQVTVRLVPGPSKATSAIVWVESPGTSTQYKVTSQAKSMRGGWQVQLTNGGVEVTVASA
ncbi:hypothetical protein CNMCM6936_003710 [Aspergillus lentulus]|uniref:Glycoside hydrolase family 43 protein n=1 Tax=Aspergillus lentulus TaxID=293939 RepID=A0AAN5YQJ3_ASPLE|nr:hypothetical protein CNMCM6069_004731 [Aspergillus lentulus]KAF4168115.1 hypothetical protein CNMCM6936_003710 [Aspergillus lentulus]KAF4178178.1 hypothetical protein CNMCM8060_004761 [Aspergillus lentulus]KAF4195463.1 hypothetical protein CNMCM8694_006266 [Aspergillus lentulus]KAF4206075.1 hypothetical protein CNMCM8927_005481 [Aspergillus lentulus]